MDAAASTATSVRRTWILPRCRGLACCGFACGGHARPLYEFKSCQDLEFLQPNQMIQPCRFLYFAMS